MTQEYSQGIPKEEELNRLGFPLLDNWIYCKAIDIETM